MRDPRKVSTRFKRSNEHPTGRNFCSEPNKRKDKMKNDKIKRLLRERQGGRCAITGLPLPEDTSLFDAERLVPKRMGGEYKLENLRAVLPWARQAEHEGKDVMQTMGRIIANDIERL